MSGWLDDVLGGYLATVTERGFDGPFIAYLAAAGFADIHQLHGSFEFGKDFIAKRDGVQWAFQTKAGDVGLTAWRPIRSQIDEMLWNDIAHPSFDSGAPRKAVLVTTGRLVGGASAEAQQYAASVQRRLPRRRRRWPWRPREPHAFVFEVWDRETLLSGFEATPAISLNSWGEAPLRDLLGFLADTDRGVATVQSIERTTRAWPTQDLYRTCLAASVAANRLIAANRPDLACTTSFALVRTGALAKHANASEVATRTMDTARALFRSSAELVINSIKPFATDPSALFRAGKELPGSITYSVRCSVVAETLGLLGLLAHEGGDDAEANQLASMLGDFINSQPGAAHPISDRWAMSLVPASILLRRLNPEPLVTWLEHVVAWICDHHERLAGLASVYASPAQEVTHLLGDPYEHLSVKRRNQSYLATVVLDLASCLELDGLYEDAHNDFAAVDLAYPVLEPLDEPGMLLHDETGLTFEANISFDDPSLGTPNGWQRAVHHRRAPTSYALDRAGRSWELLAGSLLLRDRHFLSATRVLAGLSSPN